MPRPAHARRSQQRSRHYRQPYRFEALELRRPLACEVFLDQDGTLFVIGDETDNRIELVASDRGVQVNCDGQNHGSFNLVKNVIVQAGEGSDWTLIFGAPLDFDETFDVGLSDDNTLDIKISDSAHNQVRAEISTVGVERLSVSGGAGMDTFNVVSFPNAELMLDGGEGLDALEVIGTSQSDAFEIRPGAQGNAFEMEISDVAKKQPIADITASDVESTKVRAGDGADDVGVTFPLPTNFTILGEAGDDFLSVKYTLFLPDGTPVRDTQNIAFKEAADLGDGKDRVTMQGTDEDESFEVMGVPETTVPDPHVRITDLATKLAPFDGLIMGAETIDFDTAGGKDQFFMTDSQGSLGGVDFEVDTGHGDDLVDVMINANSLQPPSDQPGAPGSGQDPAVTQDPLLTFRLSLNTGAGHDTAFFKSVGGLKYESEVVDYQAGGGNDKIDYQVQSPRDPASLTYNIAPGTGDDEVLVAFEHGDIQHPYVLGALWNNHESPPQGGDQAGGRLSLDAVSGANGLAAALSLVGTDGVDTIDVKIAGACEDQKLDISTGDSNDTVAVQVANPPPGRGGEDPEAPDTVRRRAPTSINTGDGDDKVKFEETGVIVGDGGKVDWSFLGGAGNDEFDLRVANAQAGAQATWNWTTDTGSGDDLLKVHLFEIDLGSGSLTDWRFLTGEGSDNIDFVRCFMDIGAGSRYGWRLDSGRGDDIAAVMILDVNFGAGTKASYAWDTGAGQNQVTGDISGLVLEQGSSLNWSVAGGEQSDGIKLFLNDLVMQPGGSVTVNIATRGDNDLVEISARGRLDGELHTDLGEGDDQFLFDAPQGLQAAAIPDGPCIIVEAGGGNDSVAMRFGGPLSAALEIEVTLGEGDDTCALDALQGWQGAQIPDNPCAVVEAGGGNDSVAMRFGGPISANLEIDVSLGDGNNSFLLDSQGWNATPGPQNSDLQPSVKVAGGAQRDAIAARLGTVSGDLKVNLDGAAGNDAIAADLVFAQMGQGLIDIALSGGGGNDLLTLLAFGQSNPQRTRLVIDGGAGFDIGVGTPNVDAFNCEVVIGARRRR